MPANVSQCDRTDGNQNIIQCQCEGVVEKKRQTEGDKPV